MWWRCAVYFKVSDYVVWSYEKTKETIESVESARESYWEILLAHKEGQLEVYYIVLGVLAMLAALCCCSGSSSKPPPADAGGGSSAPGHDAYSPSPWLGWWSSPATSGASTPWDEGTALSDTEESVESEMLAQLTKIAERRGALPAPSRPQAGRTPSPMDAPPPWAENFDLMMDKSL